MTAPTRYQHTGVVLVRATTDPGDLDLPTDLDVNDPAALLGAGRAWLAKTWARDDVREAVRLASPVLATGVDQLLADAGPVTASRLRRPVLAVASYLVRWQRRSTPFGLFAGVTIASIGLAATTVGGAHHVTARAGATWLTTLVDQVETHRQLRARLTVLADNTAVVRDGRVIIAGRPDPAARTPGPPQEVSVRHTRPVAFALAAAGSPILFSELAEQLVVRFPTAGPETIRGLLHGLVDQRILITGLRAPLTAPDALRHLIGALRAAGAEQLGDLGPLLRQLEAIAAGLADHNAGRDPQRLSTLRASLTRQMTALAVGCAQPLAIDVRLDARITVPDRVLDEAALAASVLLRLSTQPFGSTAWLDYQARFLTRYGPGALVPVRDLVADSGLGYPGGYLGAPRARPAWRVLTERDAALLALIHRAALDGAEEITLTDADVRALTVGDYTTVVTPQRVELGVALHAASTAAIDRGDFTLRVTAAPRAHTSMAGRFSHLLDPAGRALLAASYQAENDLVVVAAQLSFPPRRPYNENVVRVPPLLPHLVSLSEHPTAEHPECDVIGIEDLAVTADSDQLYLIQASTGRRVVLRIPHALETSVQTPPLARFIAEVADARSAVFGPFDLGAARTLPYVPRIRYRRTVLAPARWILTTADLRTNASSANWDAALSAWRRRWRVPARILACHGDLRLPLDLDQIPDRALLRTRLDRAERLELQEDNPPGSHGWIGRPAELLIPMTATAPTPRRPPTTAAPGRTLHPGDSTVVHAQFVGNPARFDDLLSTHLPRLAGQLGELVKHWWVRRHRDLIHLDAAQHLAVFLRLSDPGQYGPVAASIAAFTADLHVRGLPAQLALAAYQEHPARYGTGPALPAAERVFAADTTAAIAQILAADAAPSVPAQAFTAASMTQLAAAFAPDPASGCRALIDCLPQQTGPLDRSLRDHAIGLAEPDFRALRALSGGPRVIASWRVRDGALAAYRDILLAAERDPTTVLRTLLHEHHVRALGVDPDVEKTSGRLARAAAVRRLAAVGAR